GVRSQDFGAFEQAQVPGSGYLSLALPGVRLVAERSQMSMSEGLISVEYDFETRTALFEYRAGVPYDVGEIKEYVADMSDGKACKILIRESGRLAHDIDLTT